MARRGGIDAAEVGDGLGGAAEQPHILDHRIGAGRRRHRLPVGPAIARPHEPQVRESAIQHGPRRCADILTQLRLHQDDGRTGAGPSPAVLHMAGIETRAPLAAARARHGPAGRYAFAAEAPARNSFQVMASLSALNEASMMLGETPTVLQRSPDSSALSTITRVTAPVPALGVRMRTL